ncbi:unnamed protein product [Gongylonema pulchrum]|uniref:AATF-Che1 domain-containing protein n=1 Tax=Gongylonema pulchrum TaxID=637853 RepID=A0A183D920_9BILA|nr:unnamed protein product [Gongylonema pulchrum]
MDESDKAAKDDEEEEDELHGKSRSNLVSENRSKDSAVNSVPTTKQSTAKQTEPFDCSDSEMNSKGLSVSASPDKKLVPNKHIEHASTMSSLDSSALDDEKELFADDERAEQKKCLWWQLLEDLQLNRMLLYNMLSSWDGVLEEASVARAYCDQLITTLSSHEKQIPPVCLVDFYAFFAAVQCANAGLLKFHLLSFSGFRLKMSETMANARAARAKMRFLQSSLQFLSLPNARAARAKMRFLQSSPQFLSVMASVFSADASS